MADFEQLPSGIVMPANFSATTKVKNPSVEFKEIATTLNGRDITRGYVDPLQLQPGTDTVLNERGGGDYDVYRQVLRNPQVISCWGQRLLAVQSKEVAVDAGGTTAKDKAAAAFMREQLAIVGWDNATKKMMYGIYFGFAVAEAMWGRDGRFITLNKIKVRNRKRFGFDGANRLRMRTFENPEGELLGERKFWAFCSGADNDDEPYGIGLAHYLYWPDFFQRNGLKFWLNFIEKFAQPTAMGKYPKDTLQNEQNRLLQALSAIATDAGVIIPQGMEVELLEAARNGTADYAGLYDTMDRCIAKVILGQVGSTEGTPGKLGNDELQGDVRDDITKADADIICESFNNSIGRWLTEWNFPGAKTPVVYRKCEPPEDTGERADTDKKVFEMGFKPKLSYITETYGGDWEEKPVPSGGQGMLLPNKPQDKNTPAPDFAETGQRQVNNAVADKLNGELGPVVDGWINDIKQLVNSANNLDEIRTGLDVIKPNMSLDDYADSMAEALRLAELQGRADIMSEVVNGQ